MKAVLVFSHEELDEMFDALKAGQARQYARIDGKLTLKLQTGEVEGAQIFLEDDYATSEHPEKE